MPQDEPTTHTIGAVGYSCENCGKATDDLMQVDGKLLCKDCVVAAVNSPSGEQGELWLKKIHFLMEMLPTAGKKQPEVIRDLWDALPVTSVKVDLGKNENFYHFVLDGGGSSHEIVVEEVENLTPKKFRIEFQRIYGILLPNLPYTQWACLVTRWLVNRELGSEVEEISEHQEIIDAILENITSSRLIKGMGASIFGTVYYHDDAILVPTDTIRNISEKINRNITLRKVSSIVTDYLLGSTKTYRTAEGVIRMWRFDPAKVGVDTTTALELDSEGGKDD